MLRKSAGEGERKRMASFRSNNGLVWVLAWLAGVMAVRHVEHEIWIESVELGSGVPGAGRHPRDVLRPCLPSAYMEGDLWLGRYCLIRAVPFADEWEQFVI